MGQLTWVHRAVPDLRRQRTVCEHCPPPRAPSSGRVARVTVEPQDYGASGAQIPERGPLRVGSATQAQGPACGCPTVGFLGHSSSPPHRACDPIPSGHTPPPAPTLQLGQRSHRQKPTAVGPRATRSAASAGSASRQGFQKKGPRLVSGREGGGRC